MGRGVRGDALTVNWALAAAMSVGLHYFESTQAVEDAVHDLGLFRGHVLAIYLEFKRGRVRWLERSLDRHPGPRDISMSRIESRILLPR